MKYFWNLVTRNFVGLLSEGRIHLFLGKVTNPYLFAESIRVQHGLPFSWLGGAGQGEGEVVSLWELGAIMRAGTGQIQVPGL